MSTRYIIYLHPLPDTIAYMELTDMWSKSPEILTQNTALMYPFHSTLTGFFETEEVDEIVKAAKEAFVPPEIIDDKIVTDLDIFDNRSLKVISFKSNYCKTSITTLLQKFTYLRSPSIDGLHFTLCNSIKQSENDKADALIAECIDLSDWIDDKWTVLMWKVYNNNWEIYATIA